MLSFPTHCRRIWSTELTVSSEEHTGLLKGGTNHKVSDLVGHQRGTRFVKNTSFSFLLLNISVLVLAV